MPMGISTFTYLDISCLHGRVSKKAHTYLGNRHIIYARSLLKKHLCLVFRFVFRFLRTVREYEHFTIGTDSVLDLYAIGDLFIEHLPFSLLQKTNMLFTAGWPGAPLILPHLYLSRTWKLRFRAFFWGIVCFWSSFSSFRILKMAWENISFLGQWKWIIVFQPNLVFLLCKPD